MDLHGEEDQQEDADYQRLGTPEAQDDGFERDEVLRKPDGPHITTQASVVSTFCDFLTVAIHTILYERNIYSPELFLSTRVYNHPVRQIRHPRLCKWIQDAVDACESQISEGRASRIALVILSPEDHNPLERFVFDVSSFPVVPQGEQNTPFEFSANPAALSGSTIADIEEQLRATLAKLTLSSPKLGKLPENCTFTIAIELQDEAAAPVGHSQPWVPSEHQPASKDSPRRIAPPSNVRTTPVRTVEAGPMFIEMWIEESRLKEKTATT